MLNKFKNFNWTKNMFLVPILLVAGISISHVVSWYDMANPINWAIYLSIAIEIGAMTSLIAATKKIKGGVWFMFGLVTFIQMMGNIFYSYVEIDETGDLFKNWVELTSPLFEMMGTDSTDIIPHKRWLALLEGGLLPLISLTALHFYTKYDDSDQATDLADDPAPTKPEDPETFLPQEPTISVEPNDKPIDEIPDGVGPNSEYNQIMRDQWEKYLEENPDRELGKYDMKFGPEYTKMMDKVHEEIKEEIKEEEKPVEEDINEEKPNQPIEVFSEPFQQPKEISEAEEERQKHLKFRKRLIEDDNGKKTLAYTKRDKITQKKIK